MSRHHRSARTPRIFYWMTDRAAAAGGEKHAYEHVDILNAAGFEAFALHLAGDRYQWFENDTPVVQGPAFWDMFDVQRDYLVVPEVLGPLIPGLPGKKVIFSKNLYLSFGTWTPLAAARCPYHDPQVVAIFAVSEHNCQHLCFAFPRATIVRMYTAIDPALHPYRPLHEKRRQIAVVAKALEPLSVLLQILSARGAAGLNNLSRYEVTFLRGLSLQDAARMIGDSLVLVSLSTHEGLPRTVLEGLASGCIIAAYGAGPLKEILPPEYAFEPDDLIGIARHIEAVTAAEPVDAHAWTPVIERARTTAAAFTRERQRDVVVEAWRRIFEESAFLPRGRVSQRVVAAAPVRARP